MQADVLSGRLYLKGPVQWCEEVSYHLHLVERNPFANYRLMLTFGVACHTGGRKRIAGTLESKVQEANSLLTRCTRASIKGTNLERLSVVSVSTRKKIFLIPLPFTLLQYKNIPGYLREGILARAYDMVQLAKDSFGKDIFDEGIAKIT